MNNILSRLLNINNENNNLIKFISITNVSPAQKVLDVGCGFGEKMQIIKSLGIHVIGIDVNPDTVTTNIAHGLNCMTLDEFEKSDEVFDVILMSHLIEHFMPAELLILMDSYLSRLNMGGYLIIATPLHTPYFFEDFDHVKPYHPSGINMVFGIDKKQVQYYSKNKIEPVAIWFRKGPFKLINSEGLYVPGKPKIAMIINIALTLCFRLSFGLIGRTDGWMGLYKKISL